MYQRKYLHLTVLFTILCRVCNATAEIADANSDQYQLMQRSSILFGLTVISRPDMVSHNCYAQLQELQKAMLRQQPWAMKMYDASGTKAPGFIMGNGLWLGSHDTCNAVRQPVNLKTSKHIPHKMNPKIITDTAPFPTDFRVIYLWHNSTWQMDPIFPYYEPRINVGLCLPSACTLPEIGQMMAIYVEDDLFVSNDIYNMRLRVESVKDLTLRTGFFARPSSAIFFSAWFVTIVLTFVALARRMKRSSEAVEVAASDAKSQQEAHAKLAGNGYVDCFDVQNNWALLFPKDADADAATGGNAAFPAVNGLRFYGAMGVILFHLLCITYLGSGNKSQHYKFTGNLGNFDIFVDLFFTMSGFLQTYHFFRNTKTIETIRRSNLVQNSKMVFLYLVHRLIRLGPLYLLVICLADAGSLLVDDLSVFHFSHRLYEKCEMYWWRNAFFIQNLFNHEDMCMFWSWSSACDMQFYIFSIILLFVYVKNPKTAKILTAIIAAANLAYTAYTGITMNYEYSFETTSALFTEMYINPLSRVLAYIIGGIAGWYFVQNEQKQLYAGFFQHQSLQEFLGYLAIVCFFTCNFAKISTGHSVLFYVSYLIVQRFVFASSVCCLIFANAAGSVKWFFSVLENPVFKKFNQITYAMFLLNPLPVVLVMGMSNESLYSSIFTMLVEYIGYCAVLYFFCTIFTLFFEVPYKNISKMMMQRTKAKTS
ncbi:unnamed protein product [Ceratitis capitata]|uniref:(Mediterranean fruit fly) hypothetical protein n=1 Tax=Ceratitis capitata TaxID=7213 RepID=A0A811UQ75_CERCA|nr:unnamed protein product [Ceratitis capitata]